MEAPRPIPNPADLGQPAQPLAGMETGVPAQLGEAVPVQEQTSFDQVSGQLVEAFRSDDFAQVQASLGERLGARFQGFRERFSNVTGKVSRVASGVATALQSDLVGRGVDAVVASRTEMDRTEATAAREQAIGILGTTAIVAGVASEVTKSDDSSFAVAA